MRLTVGELRGVIAGMPDHAEVIICVGWGEYLGTDPDFTHTLDQHGAQLAIGCDLESAEEWTPLPPMRVILGNVGKSDD